MKTQTKITLDDFIKKVTQKYQNRKNSMDIDAENIGVLTFSRPSENMLLGYMNRVGSAVVSDKDGNVISQDLNVMLEASKELIYSTCSFLNNDELQKSLDVVDPLDIVTKVFGITKAIDIAGQIASEFMDEETQKKIEKAVKN